MATKSQVVAIVARVLRVPFSRLLFSMNRMRLAGHLPSAQGQPTAMEPGEIALIIVAALVGERAADPGTVLRFAEMRDRAGTSFRRAIAALLSSPAGLVRIHADATGSAMLVSDRGASHFGHPDTDAVSRITVIDGATFRKLAGDIASAPRLRAGRPPKS